MAANNDKALEDQVHKLTLTSESEQITNLEAIFISHVMTISGKKMSKEYWDGPYYDYLKARVEEANSLSLTESEIIPADIKIPSDATYKFFVDQLKPKANNSVLDLGCGFGRTFPILFDFDLFVSGIDISKKMIREAEAQFTGNENLVDLKVGPAEELPYENESFDYLVCFGTFDSTQQNHSLAEAIRVLKLGGTACISGKNFNYCNTDNKAFEAELGAKSKGHPNSFTYYDKMCGQLTQNGVSIVNEMFFVNRGDTTSLKTMCEQPPQFYEYTIYLRKLSEKPCVFSDIHSPVSSRFINEL